MLLSSHTVFPSAALGAAVCLAISIIASLLGPKKIYPSGPKPWPLVGNMLYFAQILQDPDNELRKLAKQFRGLCTLWVGMTPAFVINSPEDAKELLDKRGRLYSDRPPRNIFSERVWPKRLVFERAGDETRQQRRLFHDFLTLKNAHSLRKYQDYESNMMLCDLLSEPAEFLSHSERYSMSVMFSVVYATRISKLTHPIMGAFMHIRNEILERLQPGKMLIDYLPFLEKLPHFLQPWVKVADDLWAKESSIHKAFLAPLEKQIEAGEKPVCFGAGVLRAQKEGNMDEVQVLSILGMAIFAGYETTASVIQFFFKIMAMHPHCLKAAQEEIDLVVGRSRLPTWEDEEKLPYIRALVKEVSRFGPSLNMGIPHTNLEEDNYHSFTIPKGSSMIPNITALNKNPDHYGDPEVFRPERFLGLNLTAAEAAVHPDHRQRDHYNYGFGRRICQGIHVAEASLFIVFARVLWGFDITAEAGTTLDMNDNLWTLVAKPNPCRLRITARSDGIRDLIRQTARDAQTDILDVDCIELPQL
ncbi:Cytochrome P450 monooxygenase virE [Cladobotryum mycophilum]|uniref:Cytochrome P450 monooxygenase virE n=1 Tax=Cladobotryum mycophilum TaxID=491253 RepID=A0ABR0T135_9HYPO